jgi:phosphohistidine phosphatase SixA
MTDTPRGRLQAPRHLLLSLILASVGGLVVFAPGAAQSGTAASDEGAAVLYLVRHAEKVDDSRDPELSEAGHARAALLRQMLSDAGIQRIYSTDYIRTRDTASPLATSLGLEVEPYDPTDLEGFAAALLDRGGRALVSGHSNTTPSLVAALGGDPGEPIDDAEYDRLYVITVGPDGSVSTVLLRFGAPYGG